MGLRMRWPAICGICLLTACSEALPTASSGLRKPYDDDARLLHPEFVALPHGANDSLDVFLSLKRSELLYLRETPEAPFVAQIRLSIGGEERRWQDTLAAEAPEIWRIRESFKADSAAQILPLLDAIVEDAQRGTSVLVEAGDGLPVFHADGWPIASDQIPTGTPLAIAAVPGSVWQLEAFEVEAALPSPPFSSSGASEDSLRFSAPRILTVPDNGLLEITVDEGGLACSTTLPDGSLRTALVLHGRRADFPHVRRVTDLIEASRYVTSRAEYERMTTSDDPKAALDAFWLDCADSESRARELIRIFYDRVEEANLYFSGLREGWRTDRGMVHIVFGVPTKVRRYRDQEWWIYGEEGTPNAITFRFKKIPNRLDDNHFVLDRSLSFRAPWDRMVTAWRNGRIHGE